MNSRMNHLIGCLFFASLAAYAQPHTNAPRMLTPTLARTILLPGATNSRPNVGIPGRLDHMAYDPATQRLFVAALENGSLEVIDLKLGQRIRSLPNLQQPQGVAIIGSSSCAAVACGGDGMVHVFDIKTLEEVKTFTVGPDADNVRYDAKEDTLLIGYGSTNGGAIAVFNAHTWNKLREIALTSHPESFQLDPATHQFFANLPQGVRATQEGEVAVQGGDQTRIKGFIHLNKCSRNFPMALDSAHQRLFIASRKPAQLIVIDTKRCVVVSQTPCTDDSDDLFYDPLTGYVLVIGGGFRPDLQEPETKSPISPAGQMGAIDVFSVTKENKLKLLSSVPTAPHARTGLFVPGRQALYLAVPPMEGRDPEIREYKLQ